MGFFDLQVNGYAGLDFNGDALEAEALEAVCLRLARQNVDGILATVITDTLPVMESRLQRVAHLVRRSAVVSRMIRGIHIEGPFINPAEGYRGAHPADAVCTADVSAMDRLLDAADGLTRLVTLAPECDPGMAVTGALVNRGIIVSAGHTDASRDCLAAAIDAGLSMFTHLGNGCPASMPRHDNIIQRALSLSARLWLCFIADGAHIPFFVLKNYLRTIGLARVIVVTDAMAAADLGPGSYRLGRWQLEIGADGIARAPQSGYLAGSTVTMQRSFHNLVGQLGMAEEDARMLLESNPRMALGEDPASF